jgi:hypothetical protein
MERMHAALSSGARVIALLSNEYLASKHCEAEGPKPAIEIVPITSPRQVLRAPTPWPVYYDHRVFVRISSLAADIRRSLPRYLRHLKTDKAARDRFKDCMNHFFPR